MTACEHQEVAEIRRQLLTQNEDGCLHDEKEEEEAGTIEGGCDGGRGAAEWLMQWMRLLSDTAMTSAAEQR